MIKILDEKKCCGCAACVNSCPQKCISMVEKTLGALIPTVDETKCVNCGLCERVCPMLHEDGANVGNQQAFAAYSKSPAVREKGSSGGIFGVLAKRVIENGGVVYGAAFDEKLKLSCVPASDLGMLERLYKSKYIQSDLSDAFGTIEADLKSGKQVMVTATPCQVAAVKMYLGKTYDNLITVDFFCHGVPSQCFFDECIKFEDKKNNVKTVSYEFRSKVKNGSTPHYFTKIVEQNGKRKKKTDYYFKSPYYAAFQQYVTLRESCYTCQFAGRNRCSDLTIGDFHEIDKYQKGINRFDGVSTVITNTKLGKKMFETVSCDLEVFPMEIDRLIEDKTIFAGATPRPKHRDEFVKCYMQNGVEGLEKEFLGRKKYIKNQLYYDMPVGLRRVLKKIMNKGGE